MGTIKDRDGMDQTEAEDIKKRWQEYTEELYKKDLHDPGNYNVCVWSTVWTTVWSLIYSQTYHMHGQVGLRKHRYKQS